jgi:hypothetical protein
MGETHGIPSEVKHLTIHGVKMILPLSLREASSKQSPLVATQSRRLCIHSRNIAFGVDF